MKEFHEIHLKILLEELAGKKEVCEAL